MNVNSSHPCVVWHVGEDRVASISELAVLVVTGQLSINVGPAGRVSATLTSRDFELVPIEVARDRVDRANEKKEKQKEEPDQEGE